MNKLESAKIIVEQEGGCNRLKCEECIIQTVYRTGSIEECEEKLNRDIALAIAKQYIADHEQEQEAKPEHKPCPRCGSKMSYHTVSGELNCVGADCPIGSKHCYNNEEEAWADWGKEWK